MHVVFSVFAACLAAGLSNAAPVSPIVANVDVVLPPPASKPASLQEALLILVPGGKVPASYYTDTVEAIQNASNLRLWAVVPSIPSMLCIKSCAISQLCTLRSTISKTLDAARAMGYTGQEYGPNVFVAGHSLGGICADTLVRKYAGSSTAYAALMSFGSYVEKQDVGGYKTPVFTLSGEIDGGGARPGMTYKSLVSADAAATAKGEPLDGPWALSTKPVAILPGLDHSSFCPGFQVPGDVWPAEVSFAEGSGMIGNVVGAFLALQTKSAQPQKVLDGALATLKKAVQWTREITQSNKDTLALEAGTAGQGVASWCQLAQRVVANVAPQQWARVEISSARYYSKALDFDRSRVQVSRAVSGGSQKLRLGISGYNTPWSKIDLKDDCTNSAREVGCKLVSGERIASELRTTPLGGTVSCKQLNAYAIELAEAALKKTEAGRRTLTRFHSKGRPILLSNDTRVDGDQGLRFDVGHMTEADCGGGQRCLKVSALALGPVSLQDASNPGAQYCKGLSPAKVVDYMQIDSIKDKSTCLNKN